MYFSSFSQCIASGGHAHIPLFAGGSVLEVRAIYGFDRCSQRQILFYELSGHTKSCRYIAFQRSRRADAARNEMHFGDNMPRGRHKAPNSSRSLPHAGFYYVHGSLRYPLAVLTRRYSRLLREGTLFELFLLCERNYNVPCKIATPELNAELALCLNPLV